MQKKSENSANAKALQEGLRLMRRCPLCKHEFGEEAMRILEHRAESHLVHITCPKCLNAVLSVISISSFGMSSVGVVTDLMPEDALKARGRDAFSEDDVLKFYQFIEQQGVKILNPKS